MLRAEGFPNFGLANVDFVLQSLTMETNWAADHLQTIRTLMERSALYRRALAPIMIFNGTLGAIAAIVGVLTEIESPRPFLGYWMSVGIVALAGSFLLVRRQALKDAEPFWSPPTRRVAEAFLPPLVAGGILGLVIALRMAANELPIARVICMLWLPLAWVVLYGCALCAAGFFMHRGIKLFGAAFIAGGCGLFAFGIPDWPPRLQFAHGIMGFFFGALHLAYGVYLYFTEQRKNVA
jgi:hypothetical protein